MTTDFDERFVSIMERCRQRLPVSKDDRRYLLSFPENSPEGIETVHTAESLARSLTDGTGEIGVQIGVIVGPCYADCGFCNFAYSTTDVEDFTMGDEELTRYLRSVTSDGLVSTVSLMTIHNFDIDDYLHIVETARSVLPEDVGICSNTGDLEAHEARELAKAGVTTAYHALRLGESIDNRLEPIGRDDTVRNLIDAGIKVAAGVEPIGPEHSVDEICSSFEHSMDIGCWCCSASARVPVEGTRLFDAGSISDMRLRQIRSALMLSSTDRRDTELGFYGGFYGGMNRFYGEYSNSPKDREELSEKGMNHTVRWALKSLKKEGYGKVRRADGTTVPLPL